MTGAPAVLLVEFSQDLNHCQLFKLRLILDLLDVLLDFLAEFNGNSWKQMSADVSILNQLTYKLKLTKIFESIK